VGGTAHIGGGRDQEHENVERYEEREYPGSHEQNPLLILVRIIVE
jgi:hypothetical protein